MKRIKRSITFTLAVLMLISMITFNALAEGTDTITVSLRIEGVGKNIYYNKATKISSGSTVEELLKKVSGSDGAPKIKVTDNAFGAYVSEIGGLAEFAYGEMSGWNYRVNDEEPTFGINQYKLRDKDSVVCFYGDPFGAGIQNPEADLSKIHSDGIIKFSSVDTVYDSDWTPTYVKNPVIGAKVIFRWDTYTTNDKGEITVTDKTGLSGYRTLQVERYDEKTGVPTVLRYAPDFEIYVPFADTPHGASLAWYDDAVRFCVREEYFFGTNLAANLFEPMRKMTMTQLVTVLARIGGVDADQTTGELWYVAPLDWAIVNRVLSADESIIKEGVGALYELTSGMNVTREEFIYMFYLTARLTDGYDMSVRTDISKAIDYNDINMDYREAISWAVASGIIRGTNLDTLTISPNLEVNRATVCQMLYNYYSYRTSAQ